MNGEPGHQDAGEPELSVPQLRRAALAQDALLFCTAFTAGAIVYGLGRAIVALLTARTDDFWTIGLSDDLILAGLVGAEVFVLWNNGWRQGARGHSIGKHRAGLEVVDVSTRRATGPWRGLARGVLIAVLIDLSLAAVPVGLPTVARQLTPDSWRVGGITYLALLVLVAPIVVSLIRSAARRGSADADRWNAADQVVSTVVVRSAGRTSSRRQRAIDVLDVVGVAGVLGLAIAYIVFFSPLIRFPSIL